MANPKPFADVDRMSNSIECQKGSICEILPSVFPDADNSTVIPGQLSQITFVTIDLFSPGKSVSI